ncbi:hypothetical protein IVB12_15660 [Bradyrhizobium sp. 179]|uniref:hypothetical protein n=1 Tax=Bradyrhizobium sp. 179 TaxID=2782648 RepID=UPI001FF789E6|nr:hypothetical protein [Bradyrhizobium sp. 179]MCK1543352.1 hypothetical protein [Bradyrhizobium sp. 179]
MLIRWLFGSKRKTVLPTPVAEPRRDWGVGDDVEYPGDRLIIEGQRPSKIIITRAGKVVWVGNSVADLVNKVTAC